MNEDMNIHSLQAPLFGLLGSLGHIKHGWYHYFDTGTLFWSLTRLFGFYHRIISVLNLEKDKRPFLESDIESFIIRMRIVLNDVAFILRQLLPEQARGLKNPKGGTHPNNKEMSMFDLMKFLTEKEHDFPELAEVLNKNKDWMYQLREQRDNIVHYKSKVIVFGAEPNLSFATHNAAGTNNTIPTENGGQRVATTPIFEFINPQMVSFHNFLHCDLYTAVGSLIDRQVEEFKEIYSDPRMSCTGITLFKQVNGIKA